MAKSKPVEYTLFVSSPCDVLPERRALRRVIAKVSESLHGIELVPYFSEDEIHFASRNPQEGIPSTVDSDLVIGLLWTRLGTCLPPEFDAPDGSPRTGTQFELEMALAKARQRQCDGRIPKPGVVIYRKRQRVLYDAQDWKEEKRQHDSLEAFMARWVRDAEGHYLGYAYEFHDTEELENTFERHLRDWVAMQRPPLTWDVIQSGSPFRGLSPFERKHAGVFFGRDRMVVEACERLRRGAQQGCPVLWILGASGSGKSSLLRAGIAPAIERREGALRTLILRPGELGDDPLGGLASMLIDAVPELLGGSFPCVTALRDALASQPPIPAVHTIRAALDAWAHRDAATMRLAAAPRTRLLIGIDQAEELLTARRSTERSELLALLRACVEADVVWLIFCFRSDFYAQLQDDEALASLKERAQQIDVTAPSAAEVAEMIEGPVRAAGLTLEADGAGRALRDELTGELRGVESLPMVQFALRRLHEAAMRRGETILRLADYDAMGGATGAIRSAADASLELLATDVRPAFARLLRELVDLDLQAVDRAPIAVSCPRSRFDHDPPVLQLIDALVESRLLATFDVDRAPHVRVAHESLLTQWQRAREQIARDSRNIDARRRLRGAANLWKQARGRRTKRKRLLTGLSLSEGRELLAEKWPLDDDVVRLVRASAGAARRRGLLAYAVASLLLVFGMAAVWGWRSTGIADERAAGALARENDRLRASAVRAMDRAADVNGNRATRAAYLAEAISDWPNPDVVEATYRELQTMDGLPLVALLPGSKGSGGFLLRPDGAVISAMDDSELLAWDAHSGRLIHREPKPAGQVRSFSHFGDTGRYVFAFDQPVTFSPDGRYAAGHAGKQVGVGPAGETPTVLTKPTYLSIVQFDASGDRLIVAGAKSVWIHASASGKLLSGPYEHVDHVTAASLSPDGKQLLSVCRDGVRIWDVGDTRRARLRLPSIGVSRAVFTPEGARVATIAGDKVKFWDWRNNSEAGVEFTAFPNPGDLEFTSDGRRILVDGFQSFGVWNTRTGKAVLPPIGRKIGHGYAISPDNRLLFSGTEHGIAVYDLRSGKPRGLPLRHADDIRFAALSNDDSRLATASGNIVSVWEVGDPTPRPRQFAHSARVGYVVFSDDSRLVASVSDDGTAGVWNIDDARAEFSFIKHEASAVFAAFDAGAARLATSDKSGKVHVWNLAAGASPMWSTRVSTVGPVTLLAFTPDSKRLLGALNNRIHVWDAERGTPIHELADDATVTSLSVSPDGTRLVAVGAGKASVWDLGTASRLARLGDAEIASAVFTHDGSLLHRSHGGRPWTLWNPNPGAVPKLLYPHEREFGNYRLSRETTSPRTIPQDISGSRSLGLGMDVGGLGEPVIIDVAGNVLLPQPDGQIDYFYEFKEPEIFRTTATFGMEAELIAGTGSEMQRHELSYALEMLGGSRVDEAGRVVELPPGEVFARRRQAFAAPPKTAFERIVRWQLSPRSTRTLSAFSGTSVRQYIDREIDWALAHPRRIDASQMRDQPVSPGNTDPRAILDDAYDYDPGHPLILLALAVFEERPEAKALWKKLSFPRVADDSTLAARAAQILQQDDDPVNAAAMAETALRLDPDNANAIAVLQWARSARQHARP